MVLHLSQYFHREHSTERYTLLRLLKPLGLVAIPAALILSQPDLGTSLIVIAVGFLPLLAAPLVPYKTVGVFLAAIMAFSGIATLLILPALVRVFEPQLFPESSAGRLICNCTTCTIAGATLVLTVVANVYQVARIGWTTWTWVSAAAIVVLAILCRLASRHAACATPPGAAAEAAGPAKT